MNNEYTIEQNKDVALVKLNSTWQVPDQVCIVKYRTDSGGVDFLLAIGKASGFGPDCYSIVQSHEETLVLNITNRLSDVSTLSHAEKVLCYCDPYSEGIERWFMIQDIPEGGILERQFIELQTPWIYRNLDDGFRWFFVNGILKREDDFLTSQETIDLVEQNLEYFQPPKLVIDFDFPEDTVEGDNYNYYLPELNPAVIEKPTFAARLYNYKGDDVTEKYSLSLDGSEELTFDGSRYTVWGRYTEDFTLRIQATRNALITTFEVKVWFSETMYYGSCKESVIDFSIILSGIKAKYIYHDLKKLDLEFDLDDKKSIILIPQGFNKFQHVYDGNGLDYIQNYDYIREFEYLGVLYQAYIKKEPIVFEGFQQRFTYLSECVDLPNSGWLRELDKEDYYTKEQIDEKFQDYPMIRLEGDKLIIGDRAFRLSPWIDNADYYVGIAGMTREVFYSKTVDQLLSSASPYMVQSTPSYAHEYTDSEAGLVVFYIIMRYNVTIDSGYLRSGNLVTPYTPEDFNDPTYFDLQYGNVAINGYSYKVIGVRGVSLSDPDNMITLNLTKH